ncbi:MAG: hypothetical protein HYZ28_18480 [Myxococcales bacterium]|nr:hypothetical protein [Myxococcales bacterium]
MRLRTSQALRLGLLQAVSLWPAAIAASLAGAAEALAGTIASVGLLAWLSDQQAVGKAAIGGAVVALLASKIAFSLAAGAALRQGTERMRLLAPRPFLAEALAAARRALEFVAWSFPLALLASGWRWLALAATSWAYLDALSEGSHGFLASASLAMALALLLPVAIAFALWLRLAFVRCVSRDEGPLVALFEAAGSLWRRPWPFLLILLVTGALAAAAELTLAGVAGSFGSGLGSPQSLAIAGDAVGGVLAAFAVALLELATLQAFLALDLDERGEFPKPPAIVQAAPVAPAAVVEALPVPPG